MSGAFSFYPERYPARMPAEGSWMEVFGGGDVVLPLLESAVVSRGWVDQQTFLSGYGAAQAIPGPLFTFAAYLGASIQPSSNPLLLGLMALGAIFLPVC